MSSVKVGLAVAWPAFWTGVPIKIVLGLLLLAMGVHPWEMPGLAFLLLFSIPVDLWALGLSARTVFLDRLRLEPPESVGVTLWWQAALLSAVYLPIAYGIESGVVGGAKAVVGRMFEIEVLKNVPVPERISIELVLWGSVATVVLLGLALGWLFLFGQMVRKQVAAAHPTAEPYQALVRRWDLLRVPADQPLLLIAFTATGVVLVFLFWAVMPVTTPHPHELYQKEPPKIEFFKPAEALKRTEKLIAQAESAVKALEAKAKQGAKGKAPRSKGADGGAQAIKKAQPSAEVGAQAPGKRTR
jgi:hypothetical protein